MENKNITIEQAEDIITQEILHGNLYAQFATPYLDNEDLYDRFYDNVENPTGDKLLKVFDYFFNDEDFREEIETAMIDAGEKLMEKKIRELCEED